MHLALETLLWAVVLFIIAAMILVIVEEAQDISIEEDDLRGLRTTEIYWILEILEDEKRKRLK